MSLTPLARAIAAAEATNRPRRKGDWLLCRSEYKPWAAQRMLHRSQAKFRVLVAGRGVGKTYAAAYELLQLVLSAPSGSEGGVLAPTFPHAEAAIKTLRTLAAPIPGVEWKVQKKRLMLPGNRSIRVFSLDRVGAARGPSFVALWLDEAALIQYAAVQASMPALRDPAVNTRAVVTTTPVGKNWVWDWWLRAEDSPVHDRFRFSALDSPFQDQAVIEEMRHGMSDEMFAQEYLAEFVDNLLLVFPDRDALFVDAHPERKPTTRCWIGIDLGMTSDWSVPTLINEFGEAKVLGRWNASRPPPGMGDRKFWPHMDDYLTGLCHGHGAMAVIDTGGPGGAPGARLSHHMQEHGIPVLEVRTNVPGTKAQIIEQLKADTDWRKVSVLGKPDDKHPHSKQLDYELSRFQGIKRISRGQEFTIYEGPQMPGEFDDCVISLALANWGRSRTDAPPAAVNISTYVKAAQASGRTTAGRRRRGYRFPMPGTR